MRRRTSRACAAGARVVLAGLALAVGACGRYGPPLREPPVRPEAPPATERPSPGLLPAPAASPPSGSESREEDDG